MDNFKLRITVKQHDLYMRQLKNFAKMKYDITISDKPESEGSTGETIYNPETRRAEKIYVDTNINNKDVCNRMFGLKSYVSDFCFLDHVLSFFHEMRHCQQSTKHENEAIIDTSSILGQDIALARIGCIRNPEFYNEHYFEMPFEVDAECHAIKDTYYFISEEFSTAVGQQTLDNIFLQFINERCRNQRHPLKHFGTYTFSSSVDKYQSIEELWMDVDDNVSENGLSRCYDTSQSLSRSQHACLVYPDFGINTKQVSDRLLYIFNDDSDATIIRKLNSCKTMREQLKKVATVECTIEPNLVDCFPSLKSMVFSMSNEFEKDFSNDEKEKIYDWNQRNIVVSNKEGRTLPIIMTAEKDKYDELETT